MSELKREFLRKLFHFSGILYIPGYLLLGKDNVVLALSALILILLPIEVLRLKKGYFSFISREYEKNRPGAYLYFLISMLIVSFLFPKESCFVALITSILGDGFAGIARKMTKNDNIASITMLLSSLIALKYLNLLSVSSFVAVFCGTAVERVRKLDGIYNQDNFSVPLVSALSDNLVKYIISSFSNS